MFVFSFNIGVIVQNFKCYRGEGSNSGYLGVYEFHINQYFKFPRNTSAQSYVICINYVVSHEILISNLAVR